MNNTKTPRKLHYDLLRILAAFSVVMLHSAAQVWYYLDVYSREWLITNSYNAAFRFGVPIFVMISGALFLDRDQELDLKHFFRHNILRLAATYLIWSCIYGLYDCVSAGITDTKSVLREMLYGRYHLWFLPMLLGIYLLLPILKKWVDHARKQEVQYFLALFFILQIVFETVKVLTPSEEIHYLLDLPKPEMACGYIGYFVWGYYIAHYGIGPRVKKALYLLAVPCIIMNIFLGTMLIRKWGEGAVAIYDSWGLFTFLFSTALFLIATEKVSKHSFGPKSTKFIKEVSACTLGCYLLHVGLMEYLVRWGIHSMTLPILVGIPVLALFCFIICLMAAAILRRIPLIGKFLC